ncbi:TRAP transporter, subunit DctP [Roseivivax marinus]|uniref:TRAP transporter, subunit DctP n=1 Tax=Roseivivax marinus TaxID=1379903 RepID=W4HHK0_9RHOB|nr:TRAP transporter substrate-binding protein [Roseivivax marinus]ETW12189.1 TRAP transporter, subunit DctP [Roseivivax marinus]SEL24383.1 TRAP-type C4-dicarboxylate transport system, substrate-binding protein [Roseivivax marinus]
MFTRRGFAAVAAALVCLGTTATAQEVTLRMHQFLPLQANVPQHVLEVWKQRIEEASDGRIAVQHYPSMQLGGTPPQLVDQVIDGVADVIWTVAGYTPGRFPRAEVFELPFTVSNAEATSKAFWTLAQEEMVDEDFADFKLLAAWVHGPGVIHSKNPIETVDDLNGVKLRAPTRTTNMMFERLGATPVGMPVPAIPEALSKGVVDGAVIPWEVTSALRIPELVQNHTEFGDEMLYTTSFIFAMNQNTYDSLPDDLKKVIDDNSGLEFSGFAGKTQAASDGPAREAAVEAGNNIIELGDEQVAEWEAAAEPTIDAWIAEMDERGMDGQALFDRAQELTEEYAAE